MAIYRGLRAIAKRMGVSPSTILRWHKELGFPMQKISAEEAAKLKAEGTDTLPQPEAAICEKCGAILVPPAHSRRRANRHKDTDTKAPSRKRQ